MELIPTRRRPFYLNIVIPVAVDGVIVPVTVKLLRVPSGFLTSLKSLGVRLVVKGIRKHRDHKQVDDEAEGKKERCLVLIILLVWHLTAMERKDSREV